MQARIRRRGQNGKRGFMGKFTQQLSLWVHYIGIHYMTISHLMAPLGKGTLFQEMDSFIMDSFMILLKFYFQKYFTPLRRHFYHQHIFNRWWCIFFLLSILAIWIWLIEWWIVLNQRKLLDSTIILTGNLLMTRILDHGLVKQAAKASVGIILMASYKTAVTPLLTHWSYCSLALSHQYWPCMPYLGAILYGVLLFAGFWFLRLSNIFLIKSFSVNQE